MNFKSLINDICCDSRIKNGTFDMTNTDHVFILQEYLEKYGNDINTIVDKTAVLFEAGRFPERQAYNKDGILVTFPSKEYRDRAVNKGTHFAENPKKAQANIFTEPPADVQSDKDTSKEDEKELQVSEMEKSEILPDFITDFNNVEGKCWGVFGDENDLNDEIGVPMLK